MTTQDGQSISEKMAAIWDKPLPTDAAYKRHVEETYGRFAIVREECEQLRKELTEAKYLLSGAEAQIAVHKQEIAELRKGRSHYQLERDQAIAERAKYESLFASLHAQLHAFEVPASPLVKDIQKNADGTYKEMKEDAVLAYSIRAQANAANP